MSLHIIQSDANTLAVAGELADADAPELAGALDGLWRSGDVPTIDMSAAAAISPKCIGALVAAWVDLVAGDRWFEFRASDAIWQRLSDAGVARVFFHRPGAAAGCSPAMPATSRRAGYPPEKAPEAKRSHASVTAEIDRYLERIAGLEAALVDARERENAAVSERNDLGIQLRERSEEIARLRAEIDGARAEAEKTAGIPAELEAAREKITKLEDEVEQREARERSLADDLAQARVEIDEVREAVAKRRPAARKVSGKEKGAKKVAARKPVRKSAKKSAGKPVKDSRKKPAKAGKVVRKKKSKAAARKLAKKRPSKKGPAKNKPAKKKLARKKGKKKASAKKKRSRKR